MNRLKEIVLLTKDMNLPLDKLQELIKEAIEISRLTLNR
jgi:hypothetical protein